MDLEPIKEYLKHRHIRMHDPVAKDAYEAITFLQVKLNIAEGCIPEEEMVRYKEMTEIWNTLGERYG